MTQVAKMERAGRNTELRRQDTLTSAATARKRIYLSDGLGVVVGADDLALHLDAHLIVLVVRLGAGVLRVGATTLAAAVVEDGDHGGAARLEERKRLRGHMPASSRHYEADAPNDATSP